MRMRVDKPWRKRMVGQFNFTRMVLPRKLAGCIRWQNGSYQAVVDDKAMLFQYLLVRHDGNNPAGMEDGFGGHWGVFAKKFIGLYLPSRFLWMHNAVKVGLECNDDD